MNQFVPSHPMPAPCYPMAGTPAPTADIISPNEARFWQEWADKVPALIRKYNEGMMVGIAQKMSIGTMLSAAVGGALGIATFTKAMKGSNWKYVTGVGAVAGLAGALFGASVTKTTYQVINECRNFANMLEKDPELSKTVADYLSRTVKAEDIQQKGIENVVLARAMDFHEMNYLMVERKAASFAANIQSPNCVPCR